MRIRNRERTGYENSPWKEWLQQSYFAHECIRMVLAGETEWRPATPARQVDAEGEHVIVLLREREISGKDDKPFIMVTDGDRDDERRAVWTTRLLEGLYK